MLFIIPVIILWNLSPFHCVPFEMEETRTTHSILDVCEPLIFKYTCILCNGLTMPYFFSTCFLLIPKTWLDFFLRQDDVFLFKDLL